MPHFTSMDFIWSGTIVYYFQTSVFWIIVKSLWIMSLHDTPQGVSDIEEQECFNRIFSASDEGA